MKWLSLGSCVVVLAILVANIWLGGWAVQYIVAFWTQYLAHKPKHVPFLPAAIVGAVFGEITIPAAVLTWLLSFIL